MHEMSLMASIFDIIDDHLKDIPEKKVTKVKLVVGRLTNAVPDALQMAFEAFRKDTPLEDAQLDIEFIPVKILCQDCNQEYILEEPIFLCPECKSPVVKLLTGRELYIDSMEVE